MIERGPRHERDFTILDNQVLRDRRLCLRDRGLLAFLLSHPPQTQWSSTELAQIGPDGRDGIRASISRLEACGYVERCRTRDELGQWVHKMIVRERPIHLDPPPEKPSTVPPAKTHVSAGQPSDGKPVVGEPGDKGSTAVEVLEGLKAPSSPTAAPSAQSLTAFYVDECKDAGYRPTSEWVGMLASRAKRCAGFPEPVLRGAIYAIAHEHRSPATLSHVIADYQIDEQVMA